MSDLLKFDDEVLQALQALGFSINSDRDIAHIYRGGDGDDLGVHIVSHSEVPGFMVSIVLPAGRDLSGFTTREAILAAVDREPVWGRDERAILLATSEPPDDR